MAQADGRRPPCPEPQAKRLQVLTESGRSLLTLLNDILDVDSPGDPGRAPRGLRLSTWPPWSRPRARRPSRGRRAAKDLTLVVDIKRPNCAAAGRATTLPCARCWATWWPTPSSSPTRAGVTGPTVRPATKGGLRFEIEDTGLGVATEDPAGAVQDLLPGRRRPADPRPRRGRAGPVDLPRTLVELMGRPERSRRRTAPWSLGSSFRFTVPLAQVSADRPDAADRAVGAR
ncbi:hypothetical protein ACRAWD_14060 [Caulobacter segnis]